MNNIGLYIHIPFCDQKCNYCDFYSKPIGNTCADNYTNAVISSIKGWSDRLLVSADSLYIGGGTPTVIGAKNLSNIVLAAKQCFTLENCEITCEANPMRNLESTFFDLAKAGVNRISLGLQSANENELKILGRRHCPEDATKAIKSAKMAGINNISLDIMLGIPEQTKVSLLKTLNFCVNNDITHISAYILKIEKGTPFFAAQSTLNLPSEDEQCEMYDLVCQKLKANGFMQYEISNFAKPSFKSRHNLKYWNCDEYLGIGPSAHSFINVSRFFYERSIDKFINTGLTTLDGTGGDFNEYSMLRLRLCEGLIFEDVNKRYNMPIPSKLLKKAASFEAAGFLIIDESKIALTQKGFLVSNSIISSLL